MEEIAIGSAGLISPSVFANSIAISCHSLGNRASISSLFASICCGVPLRDAT
jgi:hypothetical protein